MWKLDGRPCTCSIENPQTDDLKQHTAKLLLQAVAAYSLLPALFQDVKWGQIQTDLDHTHRKLAA
jgi:hypothetical protein